jgi:hypothetical protein
MPFKVLFSGPLLTLSFLLASLGCVLGRRRSLGSRYVVYQRLNDCGIIIDKLPVKITEAKEDLDLYIAFWL